MKNKCTREYYWALKMRKSYHFWLYGWTWKYYAKQNKADREKTNIVWSHLYMNQEKTKLIGKDRILVTRGGGWREGKLKECDKKVQTSSYKENQY